MCAIFGIICLRGNTVSKDMIKELLNSLFKKSENCGTHASGIAVASNFKIKVLKDKIKGSDFIERQEYKKFIDEALNLNKDTVDRTLSIIGHCRFKTKGTVDNNDNNHPIITDSVVGIHNGIISNDDELFKKYKITNNSNFGINRKAQVDSEIIFRLLEYFYSIIKSDTKCRLKNSLGYATRLLSGSFACAAIHNRLPHITWLFRRNNPISIRYYNSGLMIFSTNYSYISYATAGIDLGIDRPINLAANEAMGVNTISNTYLRFDLQNDEEEKIFKQWM